MSWILHGAYIINQFTFVEKSLRQSHASAHSGKELHFGPS